MSDKAFREGTINYTVESGVFPAALADVIKGNWCDGFVAFANSEKRLAELQGASFDERFLAERVQGLDNAEGYVTEVNFWRSDGQYLVEVAAEREENSYCVQTWKLDTAPVPGSGNCWHREAATRAGSHHKDGRRIFSGELKTVEVVWPEKRLNFFITRGA